MPLFMALLSFLSFVVHFWSLFKIKSDIQIIFACQWLIAAPVFAGLSRALADLRDIQRAIVQPPIAEDHRSRGRAARAQPQPVMPPPIPPQYR